MHRKQAAVIQDLLLIDIAIGVVAEDKCFWEIT
jgi:hypothetical protein